MAKGIILWTVLIVIFVVGTLVSKKTKKEIDEAGIETDAVVSRIVDDGSEDFIGCNYYVKYRAEDGEEIEGVLSNPRTNLEEGEQVRIKYHPKHKNNARLV